MGLLAGIATSFARYPEQWLFFAPVDMPRLPEDVVLRLWQQKGSHLYCYAQAAERDHPLVAVAHSSLLTDLADYMAQGSLCVLGWLAQIEAKPVVFSDAQDFLNLNYLKCFT